MEIQPIKNETDYQQALQQIEALFSGPLNSPQGYLSSLDSSFT